MDSEHKSIVAVVFSLFATIIFWVYMHYSSSKEIEIEAIKAGLIQKREPGYQQPLWVKPDAKVEPEKK